MDDFNFKLVYSRGYREGYREGYDEGYLKALLTIQDELDFLSKEEVILYLKEFLDYEIDKLQEKGVSI